MYIYVLHIFMCINLSFSIITVNLFMIVSISNVQYVLSMVLPGVVISCASVDEEDEAIASCIDICHNITLTVQHFKVHMFYLCCVVS